MGVPLEVQTTCTYHPRTGRGGRLLHIFIGDEALSPRTELFKTYGEKELTDA